MASSSAMVPEGDFITTRLQRWANQRPHNRALTYLGDGDTESGSVTFGALYDAAVGLAARICATTEVTGRPVLILSRSPLEFGIAFFGCLYADAIAVPCNSGTRNSGFERILAIAADAKPAAILHDENGILPIEIASLGVPIIPISQTQVLDETNVQHHVPESPALLQYTSGSTGSPKGVVLSHENLARNLRMISSSFNVQDSSVYVTWLPLFHDMGLIGNFLMAIFCGVPCVILPAISFYKRPHLWLQAIGRYRATISGGPNFAYDLCIRRFDRMDLSKLDLSSWDLAFCGAESVRPSTMRRFAELYATVGFRESALYPCYGLAEATVFVSGPEHGKGFKTAVDDTGAEITSCGFAANGSDIAIVDPESGQRLGEGRSGEIWVSGGHVASGYWNKPAEVGTFQARLPGFDCDFLRTGDIGWLRGGELYVAGRLKDLIVCRGEKIYPDDVERTAAASCAEFAQANAAFTVDLGSHEEVVLIQEMARGLPPAFDFSRAVNELSVAIAKNHGLYLYDVVFVRSGAIPRTTSGKIQRRHCRELYCNGSLAGMIYFKRRMATS